MTLQRLGIGMLVMVLVAAAVAAPFYLSPFLIRVGQVFLLAAGLAVAWSLLGGFAGYYSFGHTVFIGVGAFSAGLFQFYAPAGPPLLIFAAALLFGGLVCGVLAALIAYPILRLRGIPFAIAMLGVSQVVGELIFNIDWFQGAVGLSLPRLTPESVKPEVFYYYLLLGAALLTLAVGYIIRYSRLGYGLLSIREDEDAALMLGVPATRYKIIVFIISAVLVGFLGVIYAHSLGFITAPSVFRTDFSLNMIIYSLLGGIGTLIGPVIGAFLMVVLTQVVLSDFLNVHMLITGVVVVLVVLLVPGGIVGSIRRLTRGKAIQRYDD
jgi:branched-chain amino acid transport system permease protein